MRLPKSVTVTLTYGKDEYVSTDSVETDLKALFPALKQRTLFTPKVKRFFFSPNSGPEVTVQFDNPEQLISAGEDAQ